MLVTEIVIENFLTLTNSPFRTSFTMAYWENDMVEESRLVATATDLATGISKLSTMDYKVSGYRVYNLEYVVEAGVGKWKRNGTILQGELNIVGLRQALPITRFPYGVGCYVIKTDTRIQGRSGKMLLKTGFWEEMLAARSGTWALDGAGTGFTQWNTNWLAVQNLSTGDWGKYYATGVNVPEKMVNCHKNVPNPSVVKGMILKHLQKYNMPKPVLV